MSIARRVVVLAITLAVCLSVAGAPVSAISVDQLKVFEDSVDYFNFKDQDIVNGCKAGAGGAANLTVGKDFNLGTDAVARRVNLIKALMADFGLNAQQAAGIVGNFMLESGGADLPPNVNQGGAKGPPAFSGGYGWAQWTGPRQQSFVDFAVAGGYMTGPPAVPTYSDATDAANYAYLKQELGNDYKSTIDALKTATTPEDAATKFEANYEKAGSPNLAARTSNAAQAYAEYSDGGSVSTGDNGTAAAAGANAGCAGASAGSTVVGDVAFPLKIATKKGVLNPGIFANNTTSRAGHPYIAFDILANPGTEVVAFMSGTVTLVTEDKCPGRMLSIYNAQNDLTISYLHMNTDASTHIKEGATVNPGDHVGVVGPAAAGCGTPHLHIDAAKGKTRPGCKRESCPAANAAKFVDIGPQLYTTFQAIPN